MLIGIAYNCPVIARNKISLNLLISISIFSFSLFYNIDLRSATIEPLHEILPDHIQEVNYREQKVVEFGRKPFAMLLMTWNLHHLKSLDFPNYEHICPNFDLECKTKFLILPEIANNPNYFALVEKEHYTRNVLQYMTFVTHGWFPTLKIKAPIWQWRLSPKISGNIMKVVVYQKYQRWSEPFNLLILQIMVLKFTLIMVFLLKYPLGRGFVLSYQTNHC